MNSNNNNKSANNLIIWNLHLTSHYSKSTSFFVFQVKTIDSCKRTSLPASFWYCNEESYYKGLQWWSKYRSPHISFQIGRLLDLTLGSNRQSIPSGNSLHMSELIHTVVWQIHIGKRQKEMEVKKSDNYMYDSIPTFQKQKQ